MRRTSSGLKSATTRAVVDPPARTVRGRLFLLGNDAEAGDGVITLLLLLLLMMMLTVGSNGAGVDEERIGGDESAAADGAIWAIANEDE